MNHSHKNFTTCGILGHPVAHSMSPAIHNAGYKALNLSFEYMRFDVDPDGLAAAMEGFKAMKVKGLSVTIPHKVAVMEYLDEIDEVAGAIGAVNTVVNDDGVLKGYNTDWVGAVKALEDVTSIAGKKVVVIGAGGAARAVAYGMKNADCGELVILNRTAEKAVELGNDVGADYAGGIDENGRIESAEILINTTSVGMSPNVDQSPVDGELLNSGMTVFDIVYKPLETKLLHDARAKGAQIVTGEKMLLYQAVEQFKLFTGVEAPVEVMNQTLLDLI